MSVPCRASQPQRWLSSSPQACPHPASAAVNPAEYRADPPPRAATPIRTLYYLRYEALGSLLQIRSCQSSHTGSLGLIPGSVPQASLSFRRLPTSTSPKQQSPMSQQPRLWPVSAEAHRCTSDLLLRASSPPCLDCGSCLARAHWKQG